MSHNNHHHKGRMIPLLISTFFGTDQFILLGFPCEKSAKFYWRPLESEIKKILREAICYAPVSFLFYDNGAPVWY